MKTFIKPIAVAAGLISGLLWCCVRVEIINPTQTMSVRDSIEYIPPDTTMATNPAEEADTTRHPISFDVTVEDWGESGDTIFVWI